MSKENLVPENGSQGNGEQNIVIINLEELFISGKPHPEHDPGVIVIYVIKVDDKYHEVRHSHLKGEEILALAEKEPKLFVLKQVIKKHDETVEVIIHPEEEVSFRTEGVERFVTQHKEFIFFVKVVNDKEYKTKHSHLTVREILVDYAEVDPDCNTLAEKLGGSVHEYKDLDEKLDLTCVRHFIVFSERPTTVS